MQKRCKSKDLILNDVVIVILCRKYCWEKYRKPTTKHYVVLTYLCGKKTKQNKTRQQPASVMVIQQLFHWSLYIKIHNVATRCRIHNSRRHNSQLNHLTSHHVRRNSTWMSFSLCSSKSSSVSVQEVSNIYHHIIFV